MSQYFPKPYEPFGGDINVNVDLSNYATKADIKNISHADTSSFALKTNLANLKTEVDKLDIDKLKPLPDDASNLRIVVTNEVVKKTDYNAKITATENKIPNISHLVTKTLVNKVEHKIPDISNLATKTALTNLSNTVPDISTLIKKSDCDTKIAEIESKYVSTTGFDSKLQVNFITKRNFDAKKFQVENNIKKLQTFGSTYFRGKIYFHEDGTQIYLVFLPIGRYFRLISNKK